MGARSYHHGDLRRALLDAAQAIVTESGLSSVTMSAVAKRAGVSSGAPYRHFKDRGALLRALWQRARQLAETAMQDAAAGIDDPLEGFRQSGIAYVRFAVEHPALFRVLSQAEFAVESPDDDPDNKSFLAGMRALLRDGDPGEPLDPRHPLVQQLAARCLMNGLAWLFVDGQNTLLGIGPEQAERLADALTQTLGALSLDKPS